jgi:hypothetical protein
VRLSGGGDRVAYSLCRQTSRTGRYGRFLASLPFELTNARLGIVLCGHREPGADQRHHRQWWPVGALIRSALIPIENQRVCGGTYEGVLLSGAQARLPRRGMEGGGRPSLEVGGSPEATRSRSGITGRAPPSAQRFRRAPIVGRLRKSAPCRSVCVEFETARARNRGVGIESVEALSRNRNNPAIVQFERMGSRDTSRHPSGAC